MFIALLISAQPLWAAKVSDDLKTKFQLAGLSAESMTNFSLAIEGHQISEMELMRYGNIFIAASRDNLPLELLSERFAQGLLKGVPDNRLQNALLVLKDNTHWWKNIMEKHVAKAEMRKNDRALQASYRMMDASLRSGIGKDEIEKIIGQQQVTLTQISAVLELAMELKISGVPTQSLVQLCRESLKAGLTSQELDQIAQKLEDSLQKERQLDEEFFSQFESAIAREFDFSVDISVDILDEVSKISEGFSMEAIQELNENIVDGVINGTDFNGNIDIPIIDSLEDINSAVDDIDIKNESVLPDIGF